MNSDVSGTTKDSGVQPEWPLSRVEVPGATLAVSSFGQGKPILLIHAYPMRRQLYRGVVAKLSQTCRVIACDNRGFGDSTVTPGTVEIAQYADDLLAVLNKLEVTEPVVVAGVSMGGYIAMRIADRQPDRIAGLFLCNTRAAPDTPDAAAKRESLAQKIEAGGATVTQGVPEKLLGKTTLQEQPHLADELRSWILRTDPRGIAAALRGMATRPDSTELLRSFPRPIHFIAGDEDTFSPADEMHALTNDLARTLTVFEKCGHLSPIERPGLFTEELIRFFQSC